MSRVAKKSECVNKDRGSLPLHRELRAICMATLHSLDDMLDDGSADSQAKEVAALIAYSLAMAVGPDAVTAAAMEAAEDIERIKRDVWLDNVSPEGRA